MSGISGSQAADRLTEATSRTLANRAEQEPKRKIASESAVSLMGGIQMPLSRSLKSILFGLSTSALLGVSVPSFAADLVMWERSGGNKGMVDKLVEMWNAKYPD